MVRLDVNMKTGKRSRTLPGFVYARQDSNL